jgi:hypothetical protein
MSRRRRKPALQVDLNPAELAFLENVRRKPTKALVAAVVTLAGMVGITLTTGKAQAIVMVVQLVLVVYGVWRARNAPKPPTGPGNVGIGGFL